MTLTRNVVQGDVLKKVKHIKLSAQPSYHRRQLRLVMQQGGPERPTLTLVTLSSKGEVGTSTAFPINALKSVHQMIRDREEAEKAANKQFIDHKFGFILEVGTDDTFQMEDGQKLAESRTYEFLTLHKEESAQWARVLGLLIKMQRVGLPLKQVNPYDFE